MLILAFSLIFKCTVVDPTECLYGNRQNRIPSVRVIGIGIVLFLLKLYRDVIEVWLFWETVYIAYSSEHLTGVEWSPPRATVHASLSPQWQSSGNWLLLPVAITTVLFLNHCCFSTRPNGLWTMLISAFSLIFICTCLGIGAV